MNKSTKSGILALLTLAVAFFSYFTYNYFFVTAVSIKQTFWYTLYHGVIDSFVIFFVSLILFSLKEKK